jgi:hypothetical protein
VMATPDREITQGPIPDAQNDTERDGALYSFLLLVSRLFR